MKEYLEQRYGAWYVGPTRVTLDSVIAEFERGASPETILQEFPAIGSLERVYGAIAEYLSRRQELDAYLEENRRFAEQMHSEQQLPPGLRERLEAARRELAGRRK